MNLPSDFVDLLAAFEDAEVEYLLVGGYAVAFHGAPRFTKDIDVLIRDTSENVARVERALTAFGAPQSTLDAVRALSGLDVAWLGNPPLRIDIMKTIPGASFDQLAKSKSTFAWGKVQVSVIGREDLIHTKRVSGRPQDIVDADLLSHGAT
ncbi:MAG: nucleotidyl transferase AbiEii/AbiGii toxin family protein [Myxococcaceae bacterium]